jgi:hypothetical protein
VSGSGWPRCWFWEASIVQRLEWAHVGSPGAKMMTRGPYQTCRQFDKVCDIHETDMGIC